MIFVLRSGLMKKQFLMLAFTLAIALPMFAANSPKGATIYTFAGGNDGSNPIAPLISDAQGDLYGTTQAGGGGTPCGGSTIGCGTVFELIAPSSPSGVWKEKILYVFTGQADGEYPIGGLIFDSLGNLYGTTQSGGDLGSTMCGTPVGGGCGVVFELSPPSDAGSWIESVLYAFEGGSDGAFPETALTFDTSGNLFGTTVGGGSVSGSANLGTIFELSPVAGGTWTESIIYSFTGTSDGYNPTSPLVLDGFGNFYGATSSTVYQLVPPSNGGAWILNTINVFDNKYAIENGWLLFDHSGNLFTTMSYTGEKGNGLAFELTPPQSGGSWIETILWTFAGGGDAHPDGFVEDSSGNFYGTTQGNTREACGIIFKLSDSTTGWSQTVLHSFSDMQFSQGCVPQAPIVYGKWNALYGTTSQGGNKKSCGLGCGTVFGFLP